MRTRSLPAVVMASAGLAGLLLLWAPVVPSTMWAQEPIAERRPATAGSAQHEPLLQLQRDAAALLQEAARTPLGD